MERQLNEVELELALAVIRRGDVPMEKVPQHIAAILESFMALVRK